jgi:hypothetical protein
MQRGSGIRDALRSASDLGLRLLTARTTFIVFAAGLLALNLLGSLALRGTEGADFWEHIGAMRAFTEGLGDPPNPYLASPAPTHLFTPYHLFWGTVSSAVDVHPLLLVPLMGTLNLALFLVAAQALATKVVGARMWSLPVALSLLLLWWGPWNWSGFHALGLLPLTSSYPYWFALSLALLLIAHYPFTDHRRSLASIAVTGLVFLVHPITGVFLILSLALKASLSGGPIARRAGLAAVPLAGIGLALLWPYFPVLEALEAHDTFRETGFSGEYRIFYEGAFLRLLPAMLGGIYLVRSIRLRRLDFVSSAIILFAILFGLNFWTLQSGPVARLVAFLALYLQLGTVLFVKDASERGVPWRRLAAGTFIVVLGVAGVGQLWDSRRWVRIDPWTEGATALDYYARYRTYGRYLDREDVILTDPVTSWILAPVVGTTVVAVLHPNPFFHDHRHRLRDVERFVRSDRAGMVEILERYGVTHLLLAREAVGYLRPIRDDLRLLIQDHSAVLFRYGSTAGMVRPASVGAATEDDRGDRLPKDVQVEDKRPVLNVQEVVPNVVLE